MAPVLVIQECCGCCNGFTLYPSHYSMVSQVSSAHQLLLKYIICILYHIAERSEDNLMTSANLAICLGPSLLWTDSINLSHQEEASKTVPQVVQFLIDNCTDILGQEVLDIFGHPPNPPVDEDDSPERIQTPYNDSLESLSDSEVPVGLQQMSPSSCSRDSGLILSDPHEDAGEQSDDQLMRAQITKSKSCDSLVENTRRCPEGPPLQTQVSSDSLDCDDEYVELGPNFHSNRLLLTKSKSGGHLLYDKSTESQPQDDLRLRLAQLRFGERSAGLVEGHGYTSSDSDKSDR